MKLIIILLGLLETVSSQSCTTGGIYNAHFQRCYHYFTDPVEFEFAEGQCTKIGGHLASIQNDEENTLVQTNGASAFAKSKSNDFWIGLNDLAVSDNWEWTDGTVYNYSNWADFPPPIDCVVLDKGYGYWIAIGCTSNRPYVCVSPPINPVTCPPQTTPVLTTCPTPAPCPIQTCVPSCDPGWTYFAPTDACYNVYHNKKWNDAESACVVLNGHLASIHSELENTLVNNLAACGIKEGEPKDLAWIGLHQVGQEWVWTDGTKSDYINWAPKQPDNPGMELCVETAPDLSHDKWYENWNNFECGIENRAYICKKASIHA